MKRLILNLVTGIIIGLIISFYFAIKPATGWTISEILGLFISPVTIECFIQGIIVTVIFNYVRNVSLAIILTFIAGILVFICGSLILTPGQFSLFWKEIVVTGLIVSLVFSVVNSFLKRA
jgi:hypothetical protein